MAKSPTRRARPAIPPATPPAIAAAFEFEPAEFEPIEFKPVEFEAGKTVDLRAVGLLSVGWLAVVATGSLYGFEVAVVKLCEWLVKEHLVLEIEAIADWTRCTTSEGRFAGGQD